MRKVWAAATVAVAVFVGISNTPAIGGAPVKATGNPWNITVLKFAPGTSAAEMAATVKDLGAVVTTDLSKIGYLAVASKDKSLLTKAKGNSKVSAAWIDKVNKLGQPDAASDGQTGSNEPPLGNPGANTPPDPWHNAPSFLGETNPEGILQWDDNRMRVPGAWPTTLGDNTVRVAVVDTGVEGSHKELLPNYDNQSSANTIPCNTLTQMFGPLGEKDCSSGDTEGHGTWVASRIAGAANGFASNGIAPRVQVMGFKTLSTTLGGGLTTWIVDGMIRACDADADIINMSLGGYDDPNVAGDAFDYLLWRDAVNYCRGLGTAIFASAGNDHVRINEVNMSVGGTPLTGVGLVDPGPEGIASVAPGTSIAAADRRGLLETPAGVPGVIMVSATNNAISPNTGLPGAISWPSGAWNAQDQLTYYSSYGSRIDITAPGGARKFNIPRYDGGPGDILYGGWGTLGALTANGEICQDPSLANLGTFACFKVTGAAFGWLQGTSMSSPNATGVAALAMAAHPGLQGNPNALLAHLQSTARTNMVNLMGPNDPANLANSFFGVPCSTGWCHINFSSPISFSDAYGAGMVNATAAVS